MRKCVGILTAGGDSPGLNAAIRAVGKVLSRANARLIGFKDGFEGIAFDRFVELDDEMLSGILTVGGTILRTSRHKPNKMPVGKKIVDMTEAIVENYHKHQLAALICIGGGGTHKSALLLKKAGLNIVTIPKTIDNDLLITDHTPGFGSAAKFVTTALSEIVRDSSVYDLKSVTIVEIMGRHAGWLTASTCLLHNEGELAPHLIYLPEAEFSTDKFLKDVAEKLEQYDSVIVAVSEGISLGEAKISATDSFGHIALSGIGKQLEEVIKKSPISCKTRSIELNVLQRCSAHISSKTDIEESVKIGSAAVKAALSGESGKMMCFKRVSDNPYKVEIISADAKDIANGEKKFPKEWINEDGNNVNNDAFAYFIPLIKGENTIKTKNGLPLHLKLK